MGFGVFDGGAEGAEADRQVITGFATETAQVRLVEGGHAFDAGEDRLGLNYLPADGLELWHEAKGKFEFSIRVC